MDQLMDGCTSGVLLFRTGMYSRSLESSPINTLPASKLKHNDQASKRQCNFWARPWEAKTLVETTLPIPESRETVKLHPKLLRHKQQGKGRMP